MRIRSDGQELLSFLPSLDKPSDGLHRYIIWVEATLSAVIFLLGLGVFYLLRDPPIVRPGDSVEKKKKK